MTEMKNRGMVTEFISVNPVNVLLQFTVPTGTLFVVAYAPIELDGTAVRARFRLCSSIEAHFVSIGEHVVVTNVANPRICGRDDDSTPNDVVGAYRRGKGNDYFRLHTQLNAKDHTR